jgi:hypothetical protein
MKIYAKVRFPFNAQSKENLNDIVDWKIEEGSIVEILPDGDSIFRAIEFKKRTFYIPLVNMYVMSDAESKLAEVLFG